MRRLMTFDCVGEQLAATLDTGDGTTGLLMVIGGSQTRIGSHRMYERLSIRLRKNGFSCLRYDRRGVGDSSGTDPGFLGSGPDILAAAQAFRAAMPQVQRIFGFGLCDGATALLLHSGEAGLSGNILVNPWLVEPQDEAPAPAAIRHHYRKRLLSLEGWKRLLFGEVNYRKALKGVGKMLSPQRDEGLAVEVAAAMDRHRLPSELILATGDATAIAAAAELGKRRFSGRIRHQQGIDTDSHTFARPGDEEALARAVLDSLRRLES